MKAKIVNLPAIKQPIAPSPGFAKKELSDFKLDIEGLCGFGCIYCSSNRGNYLRINQSRFADETERQIGERLLPSQAPELTFLWPDIEERLEAQLKRKPATWGAGRTLVFSMLTDGFAPLVVRNGTTRRCLDLLLNRTAFRIRVLTKNGIVGSTKWLDYFAERPDRWVIGLSTGTLDDAWAHSVEQLTPPPSSRMKALHQIQEAGLATYGMACPMFPHVLTGSHLEELIDQVRPDRVEHFWAEPVNNRDNWEEVRDKLANPIDRTLLTRAFEQRDKAVWSAYATEMYVRLRDKAKRERWISKLRYLLYEDMITASDAEQFRGLEGVLLQSKPGADGLSRNPHIRALQVDAPSA